MSDRPPLPPDDPRHGTPSGYDYWKCRCDLCRAYKRERHAHHYAANTDKVRERKARYRAENTDKERERKARYRAENADKVREQNARYRAKNADKVRELKARYCATPEGRAVKRAASSRRRDRDRNQYCGCDTRENLAAVWALDEGRCAYCNAPGTDYEHVVPSAKGGWGCVSNYRIACKSCNSKKGTRPLADFLTRLAASGVTVRPGATNSGLPCPAAAERLSRRMITA